MKNSVRQCAADIETYLRSKGLGKRLEIAVFTGELFLVHVRGYGDHLFSIKIADFPEKQIHFFGYDRESSYPMNEAGLEKTCSDINAAISFGTRIEEYKDGRMTCVYEFIAEEKFSEQKMLGFYTQAKRSEGKKIVACKLVCSRFNGEYCKIEID